ncbi:EAL domain-containing protein [Vibrio sp. ZSDZ34]|uniref:cyclic-guanylate-specific phosphodiesterase n=1 Tax=Vibrio gelatinilyticus TaxID=2893468 RepID=A0A9X1WAZ7_9VIBR|nr:EAL domain-containing protein [Vibrio gelatinilyticus]MCJ2375818.1 EAL domain-containing protein [Vibrio gelatinilyticus]
MSSKLLKDYFAKLTSNSPFFFAILDEQHHYCMVNDRYCDVAGLTHNDLIGMNDLQILGERFYSQLKPYYQKALEGESLEAEVKLNESGVETSLHFSVAPLLVGDSESFIIFHAIDTSEKHALISSLEESDIKFSNLCKLLPDGLLLIDQDRILSANAAAVDILGFDSTEELIRQPLSQILLNEDGYHPLNIVSISAPRHDPIQSIVQCKSGEKKKALVHADQSLQLKNNTQLLLLKPNNTLAETPNDSHYEDANIDNLTKLYNRLGFSRCLDQLVQSKTPLVMLYLDIDNFKNINDSLGHHIGDRVIQEVATRLRRHLPQHAILAHLGGDEFGIILPDSENSKLVEQLAERIISLINQPFDLHHFSKRLACSIGSVSFPQDGIDPRILLQNADTAMYEAKARGRNRLIKFNDQMNKEARMRLWLEIELQKALQQNGLEVWYQPKVNARDFSINGAEALVRWKHPVEGYISPATFIPVAEQAGLIEHLGRVVMRDVFNTVKRWKLQGILPGRVAINLSPEQFGNPKLIDYMQRLLASTGLDPSCITFELTESAVMSNSDHTLQMLDAIKKLGFALSIDDFGTGYSSLSYLAHFPIDELKIDRAFISDIDTLPKQLTVIENIINLGRSLNLNVVAEGVETRHQATLLSNLKCNSIQGFHFHRPQPKHEIEALFAHSRRHRN